MSDSHIKLWLFWLKSANKIARYIQFYYKITLVLKAHAAVQLAGKNK
jgi:hypothetical protein